jgi:retron-type reverse transcriptase
MSLFDAICAPDNLASAWDRVCRKNKAGGVDGQSVADFATSADALLAELRADLLAERFVPLPHRTVHIPKGAHETRRLALPTVRDKVVQEAIRRVTGPLLERVFLNVSYAYRPDRGVRRATGRLLHILRQHKPAAVIRSDIDDFFDTIDHERLLSRFDTTIAAPRVTRLVRLFLEAGTIARGGRHEELDLGVPTGSVLAPDLSNLYLHDFDAWLLTRLGPPRRLRPLRR